MKNYLVTGATGLIGSHISRELLNSGNKVTGISLSGKNKYLSKIKTFENLRLIECDLSNRKELNNIPQDEYDAVIHCASMQPRKNIGYLDYHLANVLALENIIKWMLSKSVRNIIFLSTVVFLKFAKEQEIIMNEKSDVDPSNFYSLTKYTAEMLLKIYAIKEGLNAICLRLPSVFMEEQVGGIVHTYYEHAVLNKDLELYSKGRFKRNLIYIDDVVKGVLKSLKMIKSSKGYQAFIIGSKHSLSMKKIAEIIYEKVKSTGKIIPVDKEASVAGHWIFDLTKASKCLGFQPSNFENKIDLYIARMEK